MLTTRRLAHAPTEPRASLKAAPSRSHLLPRILVQCSDHVQQLQRADHRLGWRGVQKLEFHNVLYPQRLQLKYYACEVGALDFGHAALRQLRAIVGFRADPTAVPRAHPPSASRPLSR